MHLFLEPRSVVLIGVSRKTGPGAYNNLEVMRRYGFGGHLYLAHPKVKEILGEKTYPRVADLPEVPDLAVISLGRERVLPVFQECLDKGIRRAIVVSQGFADANARGRELQEQLVQLARQHGARIMGPNTLGVVNPFTGFSTAFVDIPRDPEPPPLTLVVQSGVFQAGYANFTGHMGQAIDLGNGADLDFVDVLAYLENDPRTRIIVLHLEGLRRGREFLELAARISRQKPIIALKTGRSAAGARAALSHTGSLVGEDALFDTAFRQAGIIRVRTAQELRAVSQAFLHFQPLAGPRLGVVTATGACGIMTADACEDYGLKLAPFPEQLSALEDERVGWHHLNNPVDIWPLGMVTGSFSDVFAQAAAGLLADDRVDGVLGIVPAFGSPLHQDIDIPGAVARIQKHNPRHKPLALFPYGDDVPRQRRALDYFKNVACFEGLEEAVLGLAATWRYEQYRRSAASRAFPAAPVPASRPMPLPSEGLLVGEPALALLKAFGIPTVPGRLAQGVEEALAFAREVGFPVVLKIISPQWLHKSDRGGVHLHIRDEDSLRRAFQDVQARFASETPEGELTGLLVQKQVAGVELLFGVKRDPQFGPFVVVGMGGLYTEIFQDAARALAPVNEAAALTMLKSLKIYPILEGVRGQPGVDLEGLAAALAACSRLALAYPEIREMDLNPVVAAPKNCWCVDCRVVLG